MAHPSQCQQTDTPGSLSENYRPSQYQSQSHSHPHSQSRHSDGSRPPRHTGNLALEQGLDRLDHTKLHDDMIKKMKIKKTWASNISKLSELHRWGTQLKRK